MYIVPFWWSGHSIVNRGPERSLTLMHSLSTNITQSRPLNITQSCPLNITRGRPATEKMRSNWHRDVLYLNSSDLCWLSKCHLPPGVCVVCNEIGSAGKKPAFHGIDFIFIANVLIPDLTSEPDLEKIGYL